MAITGEVLESLRALKVLYWQAFWSIQRSLQETYGDSCDEGRKCDGRGARKGNMRRMWDEQPRIDMAVLDMFKDMNSHRMLEDALLG